MDSQLSKCFTWIFFHQLLKMVPQGGQKSHAVLQMKWQSPEWLRILLMVLQRKREAAFGPGQPGSNTCTQGKEKMAILSSGQKRSVTSSDATCQLLKLPLSETGRVSRFPAGSVTEPEPLIWFLEEHGRKSGTLCFSRNSGVRVHGASLMTSSTQRQCLRASYLSASFITVKPLNL